MTEKSSGLVGNAAFAAPGLISNARLMAKAEPPLPYAATAGALPIRAAGGAILVASDAI